MTFFPERKQRFDLERFILYWWNHARGEQLVRRKGPSCIQSSSAVSKTCEKMLIKLPSDSNICWKPFFYMCTSSSNTSHYAQCYKVIHQSSFFFIQIRVLVFIVAVIISFIQREHCTDTKLDKANENVYENRSIYYWVPKTKGYDFNPIEKDWVENLIQANKRRIETDSEYL